MKTKKNNLDEELDYFTSSLINKFGAKNQILKACEELNELEVELIKNINKNKNNRQNILEEMIDVDIMLLQIQKIFNFTGEEIVSAFNNKINKIKEMLKDGD